MNAAQIRERARAIEKEKALQAQRVARHLAGIQSVPSAEDARARDAEPTRALLTLAALLSGGGLYATLLPTETAGARLAGDV